jgi:excisionase family DNA binding protein
MMVEPVVHSGSAAIVDTAEPAATMQNDPEIPRLVGMTEAAALLGVVRERVWQLLNEGKLRGRKVGNMIVMREQVVLEYKALLDLERQPK